MPRFYKIAAAVASTLLVLCHAVGPEAVYDGGMGKDAKVELRIANGGAGQSGLVKELADAFIKQEVKNKTKPFKVAWYKSDTTFSIGYLESGTADVAITYDPAAEQIAIDKGIVKAPSYYAFRDHFLLVGPTSNPANISNSSTILKIFSQLREAAEDEKLDPPARFLSRYDKSATNIKESKLWVSIGQVPWATKYSTWYHQYIAFPLEALKAAILLQEYTLTDRGTMLSLGDGFENATIYKAGTDDADDFLLNPAHLLIGTNTTNSAMAERFAKWVVGNEGQKVITDFKKGGEQLYSPAPNGTSHGEA